MKPTTKTIMRKDSTGRVVNYGALVVGSRNGIKCLGCKEGLLLLGIRLIKEKVPKHFETTKVISVSTGSRVKVVVYALEEKDLDCLARRISCHGFTSYIRETTHEKKTLKCWNDGEVTFELTPPAKVSFGPKIKLPTLSKSWVQRFFDLVRRV